MTSSSQGCSAESTRKSSPNSSKAPLLGTPQRCHSPAMCGAAAANVMAVLRRVGPAAQPPATRLGRALAADAATWAVRHAWSRHWRAECMRDASDSRADDLAQQGKEGVLAQVLPQLPQRPHVPVHVLRSRPARPRPRARAHVTGAAPEPRLVRGTRPHGGRFWCARQSTPGQRRLPCASHLGVVGEVALHVRHVGRLVLLQMHARRRRRCARRGKMDLPRVSKRPEPVVGTRRALACALLQQLKSEWRSLWPAAPRPRPHSRCC